MWWCRDPSPPRLALRAPDSSGRARARCLVLLLGGLILSLPLAAQPSSRAGQLFETGKRYYLAHDYAAAFTFFMQAAQLGHVKAWLQLGYQYEKAEGVAKNYQEAAAWYRKAALAGNDRAQANLGKMYEDGMGVPQSDQQAFYWFNQLIHVGDYARAFYELARCYELGIGVRSNRQHAIQLYQRAAQLGDRSAADAAHWLSFVGNVSFRNEKERQLWFAYQAALTALAGCHGRHQDYETHGGQAPRCDLHDLEAQKEALWERLPDHLKDP
jgi:Sel1 repeat